MIPQTGGGRAQRLLGGARCQLPSASVRPGILHAKSDDSSELWPSSKIVNYNSRQRRFKGKAAKVDWKQGTGQVRRRIRSAMMKSYSAPDEFLVRAVACAFLDEEHGLQACATGYLLPPVSYSLVAWYIRQNTELNFTDDFDNSYASQYDAVEEQDLRNGSANLPGIGYSSDAGKDLLDLTTLLEDQAECKRCFTVLRSPESNLQTVKESQPYVTVDLHALITGYHLQKVQDLLPQIHVLTVHPEDRTYVAELKRLTMPSKIQS